MHPGTIGVFPEGHGAVTFSDSNGAPCVAKEGPESRRAGAACGNSLIGGFRPAVAQARFPRRPLGGRKLPVPLQPSRTLYASIREYPYTP